MLDYEQRSPVCVRASHHTESPYSIWWLSMVIVYGIHVHVYGTVHVYGIHVQCMVYMLDIQSFTESLRKVRYGVCGILWLNYLCLFFRHARRGPYLSLCIMHSCLVCMHIRLYCHCLTSTINMCVLYRKRQSFYPLRHGGSGVGTQWQLRYSYNLLNRSHSTSLRNGRAGSGDSCSSAVPLVWLRRLTHNRLVRYSIA